MTEHRILVIDDDPVFADTLVRSFKRRGVHAVAAYFIEQAIQMAQQQTLTDITLDLNMGECSGLHAIAPLRALQPQANLLVLTGYASIATTVQAIKAGADNYLAKPADAVSILKALDQSMDSPELFEFEPMSVSRLEWEHIQSVLLAHDGNVSATARALNMHRRTLQRKLLKKPVSR
jgi:two-component system response regulator RegA